ncbi:PAS domain S-box protein [Stenotrophomonas maltophilia]|uniref:sensor histidine kinase n=1 Tax=Stenotrophomonas muris TaxID=2963283 RepID=UPI000450A68C|nr:histidine kinase [Stenotrophomonas maltophilia M30]KUP00383.1 histidine kinase [Stenotrophomonas maltophilia]MBA0458402.1 PAS domain S-box protein [Stenotrophomonas maltophilia]MBH1359756.1 PAS domain-containing protein [Stenotrophomonas maltophilia]MCU1177570.1 PAS domain-containing protein [Stenotrophomonas maltophilia]
MSHRIEGLPAVERPAGMPPSLQAHARHDGMAARIARHDWSGTPLGAIERWPPHLRATVDLMLAHGFPMIVLWGEQLVQLYNDGYAEILADKHPGGLGQPTRECWPEVWHINGPIYQRVWQGETITYEDKLYPLARRGRLEDVWFTITYSPIRGEEGRINGVLVTMFETTAAHVAQAAREREEQKRRESDRRLALAFKVLPVGVCIVDAEGRLQLSNDRMRTYLPTGKVPSTDRPNHYRWQGWHPDGSRIEPHDFAIARALRGETVVPGLEFQFIHDDGRARWTRVAAAPLRDADGEVTGVFAIAVDIDDLKRATERQAVLLAELQHRVRNIMSTIHALAWRTRSTVASVDEYAERLCGRLMSLARTQSLLTRGGNAGVCLRGMIEEEVSAQMPGTGLCELHGEDVLLPPKAAEVLSLAIHELASNALRYGAAAREAGRIEVSWHLQVQDAEPWLGLHWCERHADVEGWEMPRQRGLGRALIEQRVPYELAGSGELHFGPQGLDAWIRFPLRERDSLLQTDAPDTAPLR